MAGIFFRYASSPFPPPTQDEENRLRKIPSNTVSLEFSDQSEFSKHFPNALYILFRAVLNFSLYCVRLALRHRNLPRKRVRKKATLWGEICGLDLKRKQQQRSGWVSKRRFCDRATSNSENQWTLFSEKSEVISSCIYCIKNCSTIIYRKELYQTFVTRLFFLVTVIISRTEPPTIGFMHETVMTE